MSHTLRPLQGTEIKSVANWAIAEGWPGREKQIQLTAQEFMELLKLPGHLSFCMSEQDQPPIGFGQVWVGPENIVSLVRVIVDQNLRGRGFGKQLSALLLAEARKLPQAKLVKLRVQRSNIAAVSVYTSLGFRVIDAESNSSVYAMAAG
jgi:ribosomal-protein-alanine N-acetyltransferase